MDDTEVWDDVDQRALDTPIDTDSEALLRWAVESATEEALDALADDLREAEVLMDLRKERAALTAQAAGWSALRRLLYRVLRRLLRSAVGWGRWILLSAGP